MDSIPAYSQWVQDTGESRELTDLVSDAMQVRSTRWVDRTQERIVGRRVPTGVHSLELRGRFLVSPEEVYQRLVGPFRAEQYVPLLRRDGADDVVIAMPGRLNESAGRIRTVAIFFGLTLLSVLFVGGMYDASAEQMFLLGTSPSPARFIGLLMTGWPFALSLLGILLAHEMGHYIVARWQGLPASFPYFIPMPFSPFGTMGAVIQAKAPPRNRRKLLLLGASGPLAGMVVAIPVLILGLMTSEVGANIPGVAYIQEGNSLLYAALKFLIFGQFLPSGNVDVHLNSVAWAGWAGMLVTALNLIPAGQLDGGHIAYALLGPRARYLTWAVIATLLALSTVWYGWLLWAGLVLLLGRVYSVPMDDVTGLRSREIAIAVLTIVVFILVFIPVPILER